MIKRYRFENGDIVKTFFMLLGFCDIVLQKKY